MAKTKHEIDREQKRLEIVLAARELFLAHGYDATTVGHIAAKSGVAPNTLYWYFEDKDALLIAVLEQLVHEGLQELERRRKASPGAQLVWLLGLLSELRTLVATLHARLEVSAKVRAWHDGFHELAEAFIADLLRSRGVVRGHEEDAARVGMFVVEGLLAHDVQPDEQRRLVRWLLSSMKPKPSSKCSSTETGRPRRRALRTAGFVL